MIIFLPAAPDGKSFSLWQLQKKNEAPRRKITRYYAQRTCNHWGRGDRGVVGTLLKGTSTVLRHSRSSSLSPDSGGRVFKPHSCRLVTSNTADLMFPFSASSRITQTAWRLPGSFRFKSSLGADIWTLTVVFCSMGNITDGCSLSWPSNVAAFTKSLTTQGLGLFYTCPHQPPSWQIPEKGKSAKQLQVLCAECWFSCLFPVIIKY